jgi:PEP-CTERM motif
MSIATLVKKVSMAAAGAAFVALGTIDQAQAITLRTTDFINNAERTNFNGFEGLPDTGSFGSVYTEGGITVQQVNGELNDIWTTYQSWGAEGSNSWYPNGGDIGYTKISRQDNRDFVNIGMLIGSGFGSKPSTPPVTYVYQLLQDGISVFSGTLFRNTSPNYLGFSDGGFDEVRLAAYFGNNPNQTLSGFQALAIDSIELSQPQSVPEPGTIMGLLAFGALGVTAIKRKSQPEG